MPLPPMRQLSFITLFLWFTSNNSNCWVVFVPHWLPLNPKYVRSFYVTHITVQSTNLSSSQQRAKHILRSITKRKEKRKKKTIISVMCEWTASIRLVKPVKISLLLSDLKKMTWPTSSSTYSSFVGVDKSTSSPHIWQCISKAHSSAQSHSQPNRGTLKEFQLL